MLAARMGHVEVDDCCSSPLQSARQGNSPQGANAHTRCRLQYKDLRMSLEPSEVLGLWI
jgi:hypothetical protein